jgi:aminoglycoside phosphotransferase (APT) family kinase protein
MHADEVEISEDVVRALLRAQLPDWAELPIVAFDHGGTDHFIFRLGDELQVRLPKHEPSTGQVEKELRILPRLRPHLQVELPQPLARGLSGEGYPFTWGVYRWLPGEPPREGSVELAGDVAAFLHALQELPVEDEAPVNSRGAPLGRRDRAFREALTRLRDEVDTAAVASAWDAAMAAPEWDGAPVLIHGDMLPANLLLRDGRLSAVLDWGIFGAGDPACDYLIAWSLLAPVRGAFRSAAGVDDATWARARGWAVSHGVNALGYYLHTNPPMVAHARSAIAGVLADADG